MSNGALFEVWCKNERKMWKDIRQLQRMLNRALCDNNLIELEVLTRIYAMFYSVYAETVFQKIIHTPHGLNNNEIQSVQNGGNLEQKWHNCLEVCFNRIDSETNRNYVQMKRDKMSGLLNMYIVEPLQVRNKIAHGQSAVCLNHACTGINQTITDKVQHLDYVQTERYFHIYQIFAQCVEDLIESPYRAHFRFFESNMVRLEEYIGKTENYSIEAKREKLAQKKARYQPIRCKD